MLSHSIIIGDILEIQILAHFTGEEIKLVIVQNTDLFSHNPLTPHSEFFQIYKAYSSILTFALAGLSSRNASSPAVA